MRRGFKTWCENISVRYRKDLGLSNTDPLGAKEFAQHLKIPLIKPDDISSLSPKSKRILLHEDASAWSALTLCCNGKHLIIYNSSNAPQRQSSDIMHELSHIIIGHTEQKVIHSKDLNVLIRGFNKDQEEEADWLSGTLLLPKDALMKIKFQKISYQMALSEYCVSQSMLTMRLNRTGVNYIHKRANNKWK